MSKTLRAIFHNLEGDWSLHREILDVASNIVNYATGNAHFVKNEEVDNVLYYREVGVVILAGTTKKIRFSRKYIYQLTDDNIHIILDDGVTKGKLFQKLVATSESCQFVGTEHICNDDKHNGQYNFINDTTFSIEYTVKGLQSNLRIKSRYTKLHLINK